MSFTSTLIYVFLFLLSFHDFCSAAPAPNATTLPPTKLPNDDAFYTPPKGFESRPLGTILGHRRVPKGITIDNTKAIKLKESWQILYRTQNSVGEPEATVTTVMIPKNANKQKLFTFSFFSDAPYNGCNPSIVLQPGARTDAIFTQSQTAIITGALSQGWIVNVPDDNGAKGSFGAGIHFGYAFLDGIRAALQSEDITGVTKDATTVMYGYSGGGVTVAWATEVHPQYAPDLKIAGAGLGGLTPNLSLTMNLYNNGDRATYIPPAILGQSHDYKNMSKWLDENLIESLAPEFRKAESQCFNSNTIYQNQDMGKYFKNGFNSLRFDEVPNSVMKWAGTMGLRGTPKVPWYLHSTKFDDISPIELTDTLVAKYCKQGATITYERNPVNITHAQESLWGLGGAMVWFADRFDGKPITPGCSEHKVTSESLRSLAKGKLLGVFFDAYWAKFGLPLRTIESARRIADESSWNETEVITSLRKRLSRHK